MSDDKFKCPYCGTETAKRHKNSNRRSCECQRLYEKPDFNGKKYMVLYKKDGTKEVIKNG